MFMILLNGLKIKKNDTTDIIIRVDEYKGKKGITIREYITSENTETV